MFSPDIATAIEYTVLALVIISLIIAIVYLVGRLRRITRRERLIVEADEADVVRDAVEAGRTALTGVSDARLAIIACYLAMERSLGDAGTARAATETADELLARATGAGLLRGESPAVLTELFSAARFSRHEVSESARTRALDALNVILADLGGRGGNGTPRPGSAAVPVTAPPAPARPAPGQPPAAEPHGWRSARSEVQLAAGTVLVVTVAAYAWAGSAAAAVVLAASAVCSSSCCARWPSRIASRPSRRPNGRAPGDR